MATSIAIFANYGITSITPEKLKEGGTQPMSYTPQLTVNGQTFIVGQEESTSNIANVVANKAKEDLIDHLVEKSTEWFNAKDYKPR